MSDAVHSIIRTPNISAVIAPKVVIAATVGQQGPAGPPGSGTVVLHTTAEWEALDLTAYRLPSGDFGKDIVTNEVKSGDGTSTWANLEGLVTRESLGLAITDTVRFAEIIIPGLVAGTTYKLIVDGDGNLGTEQIL